MIKFRLPSSDVLSSVALSLFTQADVNRWQNKIFTWSELLTELINTHMSSESSDGLNVFVLTDLIIEKSEPIEPKPGTVNI